MPRDVNGNYTLPGAFNPVAPGSPILAAWANATLLDVAQATTDSLDRFGRGGMQGPFRATDGSATAPSIAFSNNPDAGFYRPASNTVNLSLGGVQEYSLSAAALVAGTPTSAAKVMALADNGLGTSALDFRGPLTALAAGYVSYQHSVHTLRVGTNGQERLRIDSTGRVGIGSGDITAAALHVRAAAAELRAQSTGDLTAGGTAFVRFLGSGAGNSFVGHSGGSSQFEVYNGLNGALALSTNAVERMRITAGGDIGIGTASPVSAFDVRRAGGGTVVVSTDASRYGFIQWADAVSQFRVATDGNFPITFDTNGAERLRITAGGDIGIGTASPVSAFDVRRAGGGTVVVSTDAGRYGFIQWSDTGSRFRIATDGNFPITFDTNGAERLRVAPDGTMVNTATPGAGLTLNGASSSRFTVDETFWPAATFANGASNPAHPTVAIWHRDAGANPALINFYTDAAPGVFRGNILFNRSSGLIQYNTSSDARLKDNIVDAPDAGDAIDAIKVRSFTWKETGNLTRYGFVAQELAAVAPEAVSAGDDGEEVETPWAVDYSKLVPLLVREVQSLRQRVTRLETVQ